MSDIVERLRDYDKCTVGPQEAADTIEALRAENARLREALGLITTLAPTMEINPDDPIGMARNIVAEVSDKMARLREALRPFAYYANHIPDDVSDTAHGAGTVGELRTARAAMGESDE